ncbi:MAG: GNAT family N-acetyltransferase, partial [Thaumarchaeota archaeon]|nr:GNAT family N-acetyltransferase [Nitrososphaerota archaeon]
PHPSLQMRRNASLVKKSTGSKQSDLGTQEKIEIISLEELSINAWPSLQTMLLDGWILRFSGGHTKRANSVNPLYSGSSDVEEKIEACERLYSSRALDTVFKLTTAANPENLDSILQHRGYAFESDTAVQTLDLGPIKETNTPMVELSEELSEEWLSAFSQMSNLDEKKKRVSEQMLSSIIPEKRFASISREGRIVACGLAVLQQSYVGLFDIATHKDFRRQGFARRLTLRLLSWGKESGAKRAYLQVVLNNEPALKLYSSLGFLESHRCWYRIKKFAESPT